MDKYLCMTISDFYNIDNKYVYTKIKNMLSQVISFIERNLNEVCYKKYGISDEFKTYFSFISEVLDDKELKQFIDLYKKLRNINVHARTFYTKKEMQYSFDFNKISKRYDFLGLDIPFDIDKELTVYGMLAIFGLLLSKDQLYFFINSIVAQKYFVLPHEYKDYDKKQEILKKLDFATNIRKDTKELPLIFFEEHSFIPIVAEFFLILEEEVFKQNKILPTKKYFSFCDAESCMDLDENLKTKMNEIRKMWAHGNCFYYTDEKNNLMSDFINLLIELLNTKYKVLAENALNKIKRTIIIIKYKRPVEMVLKMQNEKNNKDALIGRLSKMTNYIIKDEQVPPFIESKVESVELKEVNIKYGNKDEPLPNYAFKRIEIIYHKTNHGSLIVEGFDTGMQLVVEYKIPEYPSLFVESSKGYAKKVEKKEVTAYRENILVNYGE